MAKHNVLVRHAPAIEALGRSRSCAPKDRHLDRKPHGGGRLEGSDRQAFSRSRAACPPLSLDPMDRASPIRAEPTVLPAAPEEAAGGCVTYPLSSRLPALSSVAQQYGSPYVVARARRKRLLRYAVLVGYRSRDTLGRWKR